MQQEQKTTHTVCLETFRALQEHYAHTFGIGICLLDDQNQPMSPLPAGFVRQYPDIPFEIFLSEIQKGEEPAAEHPVFSSFGNKSLIRVLQSWSSEQRHLGVLCFFSVQDYPAAGLRAQTSFAHHPQRQAGYLDLLDTTPFDPPERLINLLDTVMEDLKRAVMPFQSISPPHTVAPAEPSSESKEEESAIIWTTLGYDIIEGDDRALDMLGYESVEEIVGLNIIDNFLLEESDKTQLQQQLTRQELTEMGAIVVERKDGTTVSCSFTIIPQSDTAGQTVGFEFHLTGDPDRISTHVPVDTVKSCEEGVTKEYPDPDLSGGLEDLFSELAEPSRTPITPPFSGWTLADLRTMMDIFPLPVFVLRTDGSILVWNRSLTSLLDISAPSVLGEPFDQLVVGKDRAIWQDILKKLNQTGESTLTLEKPIAVLNGKGDQVSVRVELSRRELEKQGAIIAIVNAPQPASDAKVELDNMQNSQAIRALPILQRMGRDYEILFQKVLDTTSMLSFDRRLDEKQNELIYQLQRDVEKVLEINRQILDLSYDKDPSPRQVDLGPVLQHALAVQQHLFPPNIQISANITSRKCIVEGVAGLLYRALNHVLENALQAMPEGGELKISLDQKRPPGDYHGAWTHLDIRDSGYGMTEEIQNQIFDPFFSTKSETPGRGLGLTAVYRIVEQHNGLIKVTSQPGKGTTVSLYFPRVESATPPVASAETVSSHPTVLFIDDEREILDINSLMLEHYGFKVLGALSATEGLELLRKNLKTIDVVVLDVLMPDMTGPVCAEKIVSMSADLPIILSSGFQISPTFQKIIDRTHGAWLQKPYNAMTLIETIQKTIKAPTQTD